MIGIAFSGCACRAAFHAGVATALSEGGLAIGMAAGASSGSLVAAALAAGRGRELQDVWRSLAGRSVMSLRRLLWNRSIFDMSHIVRTTLNTYLGDGDLRSGPIEGLVTATRLRDLSRVVFSSREEVDLIEPLLASCYLPVLYGRTVRVRGELYVDGGVLDNLPIETLAERGADEVIAVVTSPEGHCLKDLRRRSWTPVLEGSKLHVIRPHKTLTLKSWDFDRDRMERAIDEGYARGREFLGQ